MKKRCVIILLLAALLFVGCSTQNQENEAKDVEGLVPSGAKELSEIALELGWMDPPEGEEF